MTQKRLSDFFKPKVTAPRAEGRRVAISLYDHSGIMLAPWADTHDCYCYDILNAMGDTTEFGVNMVHADLYCKSTLDHIYQEWKGRVDFLSAFPPCTDLSRAGTLYWSRKADADPLFQLKAVQRLKDAEALARRLRCVYMVENPPGRAQRLWRKCDHAFEPFQYGGWIPEHEAAHPLYAKVVPPRDAYTKVHQLWTGNGFVMPHAKPVEPRRYRGKMIVDRSGRTRINKWRSVLHHCTNCTGDKRREVRSLTPRGFAVAVFFANSPAPRSLRCGARP